MARPKSDYCKVRISVSLTEEAKELAESTGNASTHIEACLQAMNALDADPKRLDEILTEWRLLTKARAPFAASKKKPVKKR